MLNAFQKSMSIKIDERFFSQTPQITFVKD